MRQIINYNETDENMYKIYKYIKKKKEVKVVQLDPKKWKCIWLKHISFIQHEISLATLSNNRKMKMELDFESDICK